MVGLGRLKSQDFFHTMIYYWNSFLTCHLHVFKEGCIYAGKVTVLDEIPYVREQNMYTIEHDPKIQKDLTSFL